MQKCMLSLEEFEELVAVLQLVKKLGLDIDYTVTWEQRPKMIINQLGTFEFEDPQSVYGCVITFYSGEWDIQEISKTRFSIGEK